MKQQSPTAPPRPVASFDAADKIPRRVPTPVLRPPLTLCKPTRVPLGAGRRVIVMPDKGGAGQALAQCLTALGVEVLLIKDASATDAVVNQLKTCLAAGPVHGIYWLPALDPEGSLLDLNVNTWREALRARVKSLYHTMRTLYEQIAKPGTFLISATRLGGQHGYDQGGAVAPLGGAVTGFT